MEGILFRQTFIFCEKTKTDSEESVLFVGF